MNENSEYRFLVGSLKMPPLHLAIVGHTNTGKTSLLRTLLRDSQFGEVQNAAATTRHVETASINIQAQPQIQLYDTPGLEDAGGVLDWLEAHTTAQQDGIDRINQFLASPAAQSDYAQEAKVLRQLINSDTALYVIDAREPILPKYKDELTILSWCAKPIMPVFNFTQGSDLAVWQATLARRNLHVISSFDTVAFDFNGEIQLWHNLATMLPSRQIIDQLIAHRQQEWQQLNQTAHQIIAESLINIAAYAHSKPDSEALETAQATMQNTVRQHEHHTQQRLSQLYRFYQSDWTNPSQSAIQAFSQDPFDAEQLKAYGIRTSKGAAAGALIGLGLDALTLGTSLGLGSAVGGIIGGIATNWQSLYNKINGTDTLYIDNPTLTLIAARALALLALLQTRGHASQSPIALHHPTAPPWQPENLPDLLKKARAHPRWSSLNGEFNSKSKIPAVESLAQQLSRISSPISQRQPENEQSEFQRS